MSSDRWKEPRMSLRCCGRLVRQLLSRLTSGRSVSVKTEVLMPAQNCSQETAIRSVLPGLALGLLQCLRKWEIWPNPWRSQRWKKEAPPNWVGPNNIAREEFRLQARWAFFCARSNSLKVKQHIGRGKPTLRRQMA